MKERNQVVRTGLTMFDRITGGLQGADLVCVASRPSMGKTALALNIAANAVLSRKPRSVLIFSLEMSRHALMQRLIATQAQVSLSDVRKGNFPRKRWTDLTTAAALFSESPLYLVDTPGLSAGVISTLSRRLAEELRRKGERLGLVIIDYMQLIRRPKGKGGHPAAIARCLKRLAREINVPILLLSQVRRRVEAKDRHDPRPRLTDLLDSGSVARIADLVAFVHREGYYKLDETSLENKAELILAKNPRGKTGIVPLEFVTEFTQFRNIAN